MLCGSGILNDRVLARLDESLGTIDAANGQKDALLEPIMAVHKAVTGLVATTNSVSL